MDPVQAAREKWDVIVIGGALAGAATATLLLRRDPAMRVLIVERSDRLTRRVGESTVEISAYFLGRVLGLTDHLNQEHLTKQGMRFWFANDSTRTIADCSETGPTYNVRFPGYQVDRAVLDEEVLARAVKAGAKLLRPARVRDVTLVSGGMQTVELEGEGGARGAATARWIVDASGVVALLSRKNGWFVPNNDHPIAACWSRWRGVKSWDSREFAERFPEWSARAKAVRFTATNHITGRGWWSWWIPLKGGDVSVGIVYDQRITEMPAGGKLGDRLKSFLLQNPAARDLLADATWQEGDVHFRRNCAYSSTTYAGDGFALVGDAAAFMDPFYSPGMDWISFTTSATAALISGCLRGRPAAERVARHNTRFNLSYQRWFDGIYRDKYYYMGDHELMTLAFRLDFGCYYLGVVSQPFKHGESALEVPAFARDYAGPVAALLAFYNRRLAAIARSRMKRGTWGRRNSGSYFGFISYQLDRRLMPRVLWAMACWFSLELREGWRTWFARRPANATDVAAPPAPAPVPVPATATRA
jgi:flavin-dependent dehydrogenase